MISQTTEIPSGDHHVVHFYDDDVELSVTATGYLARGLRNGGVAIVIATEDHRRAFGSALDALGIDVAEACRTGALIELDAATTMAGFMTQGHVDERAFARVVGAVMRKAARSGRAVLAYGEMVSLLWDEGNVLAAIELEKLWNDLRCELQFSLLCAYRSESVSGADQAEALQQVCHLHTSVLVSQAASDEYRDRHAKVAEVSGHFLAEPGAPNAARRMLAGAMRTWGHDGALLADTQLVLSELATNAVVHACSPFSVLARCEGSRLRISVHDTSQVKPVIRYLGPNAHSGRGLWLVSKLASEWGVEVTSDGKTVWAELRRRAPAAGSNRLPCS